MPVITLPDGSQKEFPEAVTGLAIAESIGPSLAKAAIAITVNGNQKDLSDPISEDSKVSIITIDSDEGLEIMRHTLTAQVLASAVKNLYPDTKLAIGPTIDDGFYYDFEFQKPISSDELEPIEKEMKKIVSTGSSITKTLNSKSKAIEVFKVADEPYKESIINDADQEDDFQLYHQDDSEFVDLCRGPHLPSLKHIGPFKLTKIAGAYWKGDSKNKMLTRIYGTAWKDGKDLKLYLQRLEEAEQRDHRRLGQQMDLFHLQDEAVGAVFWHPRGWALYQTLIDYMRTKQELAGYEEVNTPELMDRRLWEASGHWETFGENMFTSRTEDERIWAIKPMNCPGHVQIFKKGLRSYRELPLRIAEFGKVHRYEPSGALHGLMRVRAFTQDDAHIFCTQDQITAETGAVCSLLLSIYRDMGFENIIIKFADRPERRVGTDDVWDQAEDALKQAMNSLGLDYSYNPGEGAFYGPKIEFVLRDAIGRDWQCGTLQVDLNLPGRLGATYVGEDGNRHTPVLLHRAIFGSLERFIGILLEHFTGNLPFWLAPTQVVVATITSDANEYAYEVVEQLKNSGLRTEIDLRNEKINYKVREHSLLKTPVLIALGKREIEDRTVSIRRLGKKGQEIVLLTDAISILAKQSQTHS
ncbi:MAG: threonine--tRNA ligase [Rhodospirillaceae bacterium]|nr:threonine--tRNA ligase [Rhodospirillaceae bacterium]|tara:strand:- start:7197 stop:9116 length:1920 start_codon:yes stop_codon:yes gene_type:complete